MSENYNGVNVRKLNMNISNLRMFLRKNTPIILTIGVLITGVAFCSQIFMPPKTSSKPDSNKTSSKKIEEPNKELHQQTPPLSIPPKMASEKAFAPQTSRNARKPEPQPIINATKSNVFSGTNTGSLTQTLNINEAPPEVRRGAKGFINTYDFNGVKRQIAPGRSLAIVGDEMGIFQDIVKLEKENKYPELASLCKSQIGKTPEWLTPYFFLGIASANMGLKKEAISNFEHVIENSSGNPDYKQAEEFLKLLKSAP